MKEAASVPPSLIMMMIMLIEDEDDGDGKDEIFFTMIRMMLVNIKKIMFTTIRMMETCQ